MPLPKQVVVIGAGVIGCSIAYHLAKRGISPVIIERDSIAERASGKAAGIVPYSANWLLLEGKMAGQPKGKPSDQLFSMPEGSVRPWLELMWLTYHRLPEVAIDLKETGGIDIGFGELAWVRVALSDDEEKTYQADFARLREMGYHEARWLKEADIRASFPDITSDARGGLSIPALQVEPYRYTLGLAQAAEKKGASIKQGEVVGFNHQGTRVTSVILATGKEIEADAVILAMGPWTKLGTAWLGNEIPFMINKEQLLRVEVSEPLPAIGLRTSRSLIVPKVDGSVLLHITFKADIQSSLDCSLIDEEEKIFLMEGATSLLPRIKEAKLIEHRGDLEGWSPPPYRCRPVVGRLPDWDNAYVASGTGTAGIASSLGIGQVMAELIATPDHVPEYIKTMVECLSPASIMK